MTPDQYLNDLTETRRALREILDKARDAVPPEDADPAVIARWEGAFGMIRAVILEHVEPLYEAWRTSAPHWRSTERLALPNRFEVRHFRDLPPGAQTQARQAGGEEEYCWYLLDTKTGSVVGCDGGEPEDQLLVRDWAWIANAMNDVAEGRNPPFYL